MPPDEPTASTPTSSATSTHALSDYGVDVWFLYGSFTYGLESRVCSYTAQSLTLEVILDADDSLDDVAAFLETLVDNPRGLVRSELCVYAPRESEPVRVFTEVAPTLASLQPPLQTPGAVRTSSPPTARTVRLRFSHLCAPTPEGDHAWQELVTKVWPRLTSA